MHIHYSIAFFLIFCCSSIAQESKNKDYPISKTEKEWKEILSPSAYHVLRESGTERAFTSPLNKNYKEGIYVCVACNTPLYTSKRKYDSGSGWPSFDSAIEGRVGKDVDYKIGYARTELICNTCGGHLGHSFQDGPIETTGERHCINGVALKFVSKDKNE